MELDLVVTDDHPDPATRRITAIGSSKRGTSSPPRAVEARLLLVGSSFDHALLVEVADRDDVEIVDLDAWMASTGVIAQASTRADLVPNLRRQVIGRRSEPDAARSARRRPGCARVPRAAWTWPRSPGV